MANVTAGYNWVSGEVVTPAKMNSAAVPTISNIVDADIDSGAAIAGTKIAPSFGSQNVTTTGTVTSAKFAPTGTSAAGDGVYLPAANSVAISTNGSERARITSIGDFLVGTTSAITVTSGSTDGVTLEPGGVVVASKNQNPSAYFRRRTNDGDVVQFHRDTAQVGSVSVTTTATSYNTSSDYRLKDNQQPMVGALLRLSQINPVTFTWKSNGSQGEGFIAHELQSVAPDAVTGEKDAVDADGNPKYQGVDASKLVPLLVAAVKELGAKVEALEAK